MARTAQQFTDWLAGFADAVEDRPSETQWKQIKEQLDKVKEPNPARDPGLGGSSGSSIPRAHPLDHWNRKVGPGLYNDDTTHEQLCCNTNRTQDVSDLFGMPRGFVFGIVADDDDDEGDQNEAPLGFGRYH